MKIIEFFVPVGVIEWPDVLVPFEDVDKEKEKDTSFRFDTLLTTLLNGDWHWQL